MITLSKFKNSLTTTYQYFLNTTKECPSMGDRIVNYQNIFETFFFEIRKSIKILRIFEKFQNISIFYHFFYGLSILSVKHLIKLKFEDSKKIELLMREISAFIDDFYEYLFESLKKFRKFQPFFNKNFGFNEISKKLKKNFQYKFTWINVLTPISSTVVLKRQWKMETDRV